MQACLSARKDRESSFHHCGGPVKLVKDCVCAGKTVLTADEGDVNHVQVCLSAKKD